MADGALAAHLWPMSKKNDGAKILAAVVGVVVLGTCCVTGIGALGYGGSGSYVVRSRAVEPGIELRNIARSQEAYCRTHGSYASSAGPQPPAPGGTERVTGDFASDPGFRGIDYAATGPVYFSYSIAPGAIAGHVELRATGDVDGDGETSTHTITCVPEGCACAETPTSTGDADERVDG